MTCDPVPTAGSHAPPRCVGAALLTLTFFLLSSSGLLVSALIPYALDSPGPLLGTPNLVFDGSFGLFHSLINKHVHSCDALYLSLIIEMIMFFPPSKSFHELMSYQPDLYMMLHTVDDLSCLSLMDYFKDR